MLEDTSDEVDALNRENRSAWDRNAAWWDDRMGEGDKYKRLLIGPATERLLALQPDELILDIACGNGSFSRRLAELGGNVVAFDFSEEMVARARDRTVEHRDAIEYAVVDATDEQRLLALGERRFDAAVCSMALMDMATIDVLTGSLARMLKAGGRFVFSVSHPCFNSAEGTSVVAERNFEGRGRDEHFVKVSRYLHPSAWKGEALAGQPELQYYFHRPLSVLFGSCFDAGFVLDGLEEPTFDQSVEASNALAWANLREIPPVLVARLRLPAL